MAKDLRPAVSPKDKGGDDTTKEVAIPVTKYPGASRTDHSG